MLDRKNTIQLLTIVPLLLILIGCIDQLGGDQPVGGDYAPVIEEAYASPATIAPGETTTLHCTAYDRDWDELSYKWSAADGSFPNGFWGNEVEWLSPAATGTFNIIATVSDGVHETERAAVVNIESSNGGGGGNGDENHPPSTPICISPPHLAQGVDNNVTLSWLCSDPDGDPLLFDLHYGTSPTPPQYRYNMTASSENLGEITYNTTYYWKVVAKDGKGTDVSGPVWSFSTGGGNGGGGGDDNHPPGRPTHPQPANGASNVSNFITLSWICSDQDGDQLTYDLYFGSSPNPPLYRYNMSGISEYLGEVARNATYYWKVVARDPGGLTTSGSEWHFKTWTQGGNSQPDPPGNPNPPDLSEHIPINQTLSWSCSDPDDDSLLYDLYFGIAGDPDFRKIRSEQPENSYSFFTLLERRTTYVWQVIAKDEVGNETRGNQWTFTTVE